MDFEKEKADFLSKKDKSKKGSIDKDVLELVNLINSFDDAYTTSSCAGRIVLLEMKSPRKDQCNWILSKHSNVKASEIIKALEKNRSKNVIWLKQQPVILHVACRSLQSAIKFLDACRKVFKRSGIMSITSHKVMIEIIGSEHLETVVRDDKFIAPDDYIKNIIKYANKNFNDNKTKIEKINLMLKNEY